VSCARNMETANHVATEIFTSLKDEDLAEPIEAITELGEKIRRSMMNDRDDAQCIVVINRDFPRLFLFQYGSVEGRWESICQEMFETAVAGDTTNAAIFWAERYYRKCPLRELVPLAAQLVMSAAYLNSAMVRGLEIVTSDQTGIHRLSDKSINQLQSATREWDTRIMELFSGYPEQFSYAPDVSG
jgi:hypothetical protein